MILGVFCRPIAVIAEPGLKVSGVLDLDGHMGDLVFFFDESMGIIQRLRGIIGD